MKVSFNVPSAVVNANASSFVLASEARIVLATTSNNSKNFSFLATKNTYLKCVNTSYKSEINYLISYG